MYHKHQQHDWRELVAHDYNQRAQANRPSDPTAIAAEVRRLRKDGLKPRDISTALRVGITEVLEALSTNGDHEP